MVVCFVLQRVWLKNGDSLVRLAAAAWSCIAMREKDLLAVPGPAQNPAARRGARRARLARALRYILRIGCGRGRSTDTRFVGGYRWLIFECRPGPRLAALADDD